MNYHQMTAPCGLACFNCQLYLAKEDQALRKKFSQQSGFPIEEAFCEGCRNQEGIIRIVGITETCSIYRCIKSKGLEFCSDCPGFPCDHLHPYADMAAHVPHNTKVFNLCLIKKMGLESWAKDKAKSVAETYFKGKFKL